MLTFTLGFLMADVSLQYTISGNLRLLAASILESFNTANDSLFRQLSLNLLQKSSNPSEPKSQHVFKYMKEASSLVHNQYSKRPSTFEHDLRSPPPTKHIFNYLTVKMKITISTFMLLAALIPHSLAADCSVGYDYCETNLEQSGRHIKLDFLAFDTSRHP